MLGSNTIPDQLMLLLYFPFALNATRPTYLSQTSYCSEAFCPCLSSWRRFRSYFRRTTGNTVIDATESCLEEGNSQSLNFVNGLEIHCFSLDRIVQRTHRTTQDDQCSRGVALLAWMWNVPHRCMFELLVLSWSFTLGDRVLSMVDVHNYSGLWLSIACLHLLLLP